MTLQQRRWLRALDIARILFEEEGYHCVYLEEIEQTIRKEGMKKMLYSPRIRDDLIHKIWLLGKHEGKAMTKVVDEILRPALERIGELGLFRDIEAEEEAVKKLADYIQNIINSKKKKTAEIIELLRKIA